MELERDRPAGPHEPANAPTLRPRSQAAYPERYDDASIIPDEDWKRLQPEHDDQEAPAAPDAIRLRRQDRPFDPALLLHGFVSSRWSVA